MALLNNLYIFVVKEDVNEDVESTSHPVESGLEITDTVRRKPTSISLSGYIVDAGSLKAQEIRASINKLKNEGSLIKYVGNNVVSDMQIQSFRTGYANTTWGGMSFTMELKEVRIAKSAYQPPQQQQPSNSGSNSGSTTTPKPNTATEIKKGSTVVFKGGSVYVSSDAKKAAANRGRSTCTVQNINTKSWAKHPYHLISKDGGKVYGWVDKKDIEGVTTNTTAGKTNGGTQQVTQKSNKPVYHTVKSGDTIWSLVTKKYKSLGKSSQWVIDNNPKAFAKKGKANTLQVGKKLLMGYSK